MSTLILGATVLDLQTSSLISPYTLGQNERLRYGPKSL